ncbi:aspartyl-phosphate phosphatase Spo0E family protein [Clostridium intestinale]|uniref:Spo0E like sporulation regulatory protein n=1 Tax=Clostridium intestinale DSM 6191 TaxID=1121320 RepID=A0A1M5VSE2_9CLOT|nr:aspartyl-phosphate phosphatase Spo0E family protein [Clostridium intestinale]SHH77894.1 Spo0E like sporulation regulatory protein [Clostridium intestinale DSM 6191]
MIRIISIIEKKRRSLHKSINMYGISDNRVLTKSRELDKLILIEQRRRRLCLLNTAKYFNACAAK